MSIKLSASWVASIIVIASAACAACAPASPIIIGFAASLSGKDYMLGVEGRNAAELFIDRINDEGGIGGQPLKLEIRDLRSDLSNVATATRELAALDPIAIVGYYTSAEAAAAVVLGRFGEIPIVSPSATSDSLSGKRDRLLRTIMSSEYDAPALVSRMKERGITRLVIIATNGNKPYVETYARPLREAMDVAADFRYGTIADLDYEAVRAALGDDGGKETAAAAVMIIASSLETGNIAQELAIRGLSVPLYVSGWAGNDDLITYGGKAVEGAVFIHQTDPDQSGVQTMAKLYKDVFKVSPGYGAIQTWDSMLLVLTAIEQGRGRTDAVRDALFAIRSFQGLAGTIALDEYGDARRQVYIKTVADGRIRIIGKIE